MIHLLLFEASLLCSGGLQSYLFRDGTNCKEMVVPRIVTKGQCRCVCGGGVAEREPMYMCVCVCVYMRSQRRPVCMCVCVCEAKTGLMCSVFHYDSKVSIYNLFSINLFLHCY